MRLIEATINRLEVRDPVRAESLWMYPLIDKELSENGYDLVNKAFADGTLEVTEVSESGTVPTLRVTNSAPRPVLLLDGEELIGAKQNRVLNMTVLVDAKTTIDVPVSCVEAGRWAYRSRKFRGTDWIMYAEGRAQKMKHVSRSLRHDSRMSDQGEVWTSISAKAARMSAESPTSAHEAMYVKYSASLDESVEQLNVCDGQVGAIFAVNGRITGLELMGTSTTFSSIYPKIVRSYAIDALDPEFKGYAGQPDDVRKFLSALTSLQTMEYPSIGVGHDVRLEGHGLQGAGLVVDNRVVHLSVLDDREVAPEKNWRTVTVV